MQIQDLNDLRQDMRFQADAMRREAERMAQLRPDEADNLRRIADRLDVYRRDFLHD